MKPSILSTPMRDLAQADAVTLERERLLQRALDETYFRFELTANNVVLGGATVATNSNARVLRFADGVSVSASRTVEERELWVRTRPKVELIYTSPTNGTNTFNFQFDLWVFGVGGTTAGSNLTGTWSAPGPAAANDWLTTQFTFASTLYSSPFGAIRARLLRAGAADANNNDLDVLLALVTLEEVA